MDSDTAADFARLGVPAEQIAAARAAQARHAVPGRRAAASRGPVLELARHLWPAVQLADAMRTQMRAVALPVGVLYLGLDYGVRDILKRDLGLPMRGPGARALQQQLQVIEDEMLVVLNSRRAA